MYIVIFETLKIFIQNKRQNLIEFALFTCLSAVIGTCTVTTTTTTTTTQTDIADVALVVFS